MHHPRSGAALSAAWLAPLWCSSDRGAPLPSRFVTGSHAAAVTVRDLRDMYSILDVPEEGLPVQSWGPPTVGGPPPHRGLIHDRENTDLDYMKEFEQRWEPDRHSGD